MPAISAIAVFCGSSTGFDPVFSELAFELGASIARMGAKLVYGGAQVGLMGAVADGALSQSGHVAGVLPGFLQTKEIAHTGLSEMLVVDTMHERKLLMHSMSDAVIALPGGWGTMEELTEMLTWAQLGLHQKPIGLLNVNGFYDGLLGLTASMQQNGFLKPEHASLLVVRQTISDLLEALKHYEAPALPKWITEATT